MTDHRRYVGPIKHLYGEMALVRDESGYIVLAQFDNRDLTRSGKPIDSDSDRPADALGYGWHPFAPTAFAPV